MGWMMTAAPYCLLLLALALHVEAARPHRSMVGLDEESTMAKLRFEAGDPACGRFHFRYECFDVPHSSHTSSTQEPAAFVEDAQVLPDGYPQDLSDCGPLGKHKYRCVPPMEKTPSPEEVAALAQDAQVLPSDPSDCGPLGKHKYRCVPPMKTSAPDEEISRVGPEEAYQPAQSDCGPLSKHKYRCVPPMH